jgi:hypothetical protein
VPPAGAGDHVPKQRFRCVIDAEGQGPPP